MFGNIIVAIDGFSSTGKSTFAKLLAKELGLLYLDSGALYRGVTYFAQQKGLITEDNIIKEELKAELLGLNLHFGSDGKLYIDDTCIEAQIRSMAVASQVSPIATVAYVREYVDSILHKSAEGYGVVMDGRDIGTTVFPNADIKIFMTASDQIRAKRRFDELVSKGDNPNIEEVLFNLKERDYIDSHRETSPLKQAEDAFVLDNSYMTLSEEIHWAKGLIRGKLAVYETC